jgi:pullulanase/glycogen debranching enzyme
MFQQIMPSIVNCVTHHTCGFIEKKVVKHIAKANIERVILIPHTHITHEINDSNKTNHAWMV